MKKLLATLLASTMALTTIGGLVACGGDNTPTGPKGEGSLELPSITVELKVWAPDGAVATFESIFEDFKKSNPNAANYSVTFEAKGEGDAASAVRTDPATGPHIYFLASDQIDKNAEAGALQALPDVFVNNIQARDAKGAVDAAYLAEDTDKEIEEGYYAFPNANSNGYFLIYDKNYYTADDVKSLDKMVAKAEKDGKKILFNYNNGFYNPSMFFGMGLGLGDTSSDYEVDIDSELGYEAGRTFVKYFGKGADGVFSTDGGNNGIAEGFKAGDVVAGVMGTWVNENGYMDKLVAENPGWTADRVGYTQLPKFTDTKGKEYQMGSFMGAKYCGVNPAKPEQEVIAALGFADFLNRKENQIKRFLATSDAPTNNEAAQDSRVTANPMIAALAKQNGAGGRMQLVTPKDFWSAFETFGNNVYSGTTNADNIQAGIDALATSLRNK